MVNVNGESCTNGDRWMMEKIMSDPRTVTGGDLTKYVKELEGKGRNSTELLRLLQLAVEANEKDDASF